MMLMIRANCPVEDQRENMFGAHLYLLQQCTSGRGHYTKRQKSYGNGFRSSQLTVRRFYILNAMHARQGKRWFRRIVLLIVTVTLLLALLIPQPQNHHGTALATILLLPLFLFGIIEIQTASWLPGSLEEPSARPLTCRPSLFQRPPPPLFA